MSSASGNIARLDGFSRTVAWFFLPAGVALPAAAYSSGVQRVLGSRVLAGGFCRLITSALVTTFAWLCRSRL